jgi:hypothetical protein
MKEISCAKRVRAPALLPVCELGPSNPSSGRKLEKYIEEQSCSASHRGGVGSRKDCAVSDSFKLTCVGTLSHEFGKDYIES